MEINKFKRGDLIHRLRETSYGDYSYTDTPIIFLGLKDNLLLYVPEEHLEEDARISVLALNRGRGDDQWEHWPSTLIEKASQFLRKRFKK